MSQSHETNAKTELAPFEIWEVMLDNSTVKFREPLVLTPTRMHHDSDEPGDVEYWEVVDRRLAIDVYAETVDELIEAVHSAIRIAWRVFVRVPDDRLIPATKRIQQNYLAIAEEIDE